MDVEVLGRKLVELLVEDKLEVEVQRRENWVEKTDTGTTYIKAEIGRFGLLDKLQQPPEALRAYYITGEQGDGVIAYN